MMRGLVALRRAPLHRCVRSLRGRATRVEASGPDAVATVNARLGERTAHSFVLGGATGHGFSDGSLDADAIVDVAADAVLPADTWAAATRFECGSPPLLLAAAEDDALPAALADEALFARDPATLTFALCAAGDAGPTIGRLDALFPGCRVAAAAARFVKDGSGERRALVGAALFDVGDARPVAAALAELAPHDFAANGELARDLFAPGAAADGAAPAGAPCFVMDGDALDVGETRTFRVFESRYKLMIRECLDCGAPLVVVGPSLDALGSLCRVVNAAHDPAAAYGSTVALTCERRVLARDRTTIRAEFGLVRAHKLDDPE